MLEYGVPVGGPFDDFSAHVANHLVGNGESVAILECLGGVLELGVESPTAIALSGAEASISVYRNGGALASGSLAVGDRVVVECRQRHARLYLALPGGVQGDPAPGGRLTAIDASPRKPAVLSRFPAPTERVYFRWAPTFEVHEHPDSQFATVGVHSDRRGVRLAVDHAQSHELRLRSEPQCVGAVEWTPNGEWIVLGPDGPTIGGYPRLGWVVRASMPTIAQALPGSRIHLVPVDEEEERRRNATYDANKRLFVLA